MHEPRDAYKVLQVDPEADLEVIQSAYRRLAQKYHPDRAAARPDVAAAELRMVEINAAWDLLRDPARRRSYDRQRSERGGQAVEAGGGGGHPASPEREAPSGGPHSEPRAAGAGTAADTGTSNPHVAFGPNAARAGRSFGAGEAGAPPGRPSGSVLDFGRYRGWSLGEVARVEPGYLEWLDRAPIGRAFRAELDALLRQAGLRGEGAAESRTRGLFRGR